MKKLAIVLLAGLLSVAPASLMAKDYNGSSQPRDP
jgi:hypothetical protein